MFVEMPDEELKCYLRRLLEIDDDRLGEDLKNHSVMYGEFGVMLSKARADYEKKKLQLQVLEAELGERFRKSLPKVTERAVEEAIVRTPEWQEMKREVIEAKLEVDILSALVDAIEHKKDMLVSYLAWLRRKAEMSEAL